MLYEVITILVTIIVDFTMNFVADRLNIGKLTTHLPEKFSDVYDQKRYEQSYNFV